MRISTESEQGACTSIERAAKIPAVKRSHFVQAGLLTLATLAVSATLPATASAFGDEGAFHPRVLLTGTARWEGPRKTAPAQWAWELKRRTSAPARTVPKTVRADSSTLLAEPFVIWTGEGPIAALTAKELSGLQQFLLAGGILFVDDAAPETGQFGRDARRELARVFPHDLVMPLPENHVIYHSFYMLPRPVGRVEGPAQMEAIIRGGSAQVIFSSHDVLGALARDSSGLPSFSVVPRGDMQREYAARLAVNLAMYVLCSNYKDDQVHAPDLMRRKATQPQP